MSIKSREDANRYYQLVNELVDEYMAKGKIRPSNLKRYLQPGSERFKKFLQRNKLNEITGIDRVLEDVIEDRASMEADGVLTFESFKIFESDEYMSASIKQAIYKMVDKADVEMEKALADYFDTNLGSIDVIDADKHIFYIEEENVEAVCFSLEEMKVIEDNVVEHLFHEMKKKDVNLIDPMIGDLSISIGEIVSSSEEVRKAFDSALRDKLDDGMLAHIIGETIGHDAKHRYSAVEMDSIRNYYIWYWR